MSDRFIYWQDVRAVCICMVVLIHLSLGSNDDSSQYLWLFLRQFINFPVAVFIFLSGFFCNFRAGDSVISYYKKRLSRLLIPYCLFSFLYLFIMPMLRGDNVEDILFKLLTGHGHMYFLLVLVQLTIITPFIINYRNNGYFKILPFTLFVGYSLIYYKYNYNHVTEYLACQTPFLPWCLFYYLGIEMKFNTSYQKIKIISPLLFCGLILISLIVSFVEAYTIFVKTGNYAFSISQIKISSILYSICVILFLYRCFDHNIKESPLTTIGNYSMGVYLLHPFFYGNLKFIVSRVLPSIDFKIYPYLTYRNLLIWVLSILLSVAASYIFNRISPKMTKIIGLI